MRVIGQFAIPILDSQAVWMSGTPTKIAYMNTKTWQKLLSQQLIIQKLTERHCH